MPAFDTAGDPSALAVKWCRWKRAFELYLAARGETPEAQKRALLLHCAGILLSVPAGSPSRGGDVKVYVLDINQPCLPTPFTLFLYLFLSYGPFTCISFKKISRQLSVFSLCSPSLISASLVLSTIYIFLKVSLNGL